MPHKLTQQEQREADRIAKVWFDRQMHKCPYRDADTLDDCIHPERDGTTCSAISICPAFRDKQGK